MKGRSCRKRRRHGGKVKRFSNIRLLRDGKFVDDDLWVRGEFTRYGLCYCLALRPCCLYLPPPSPPPYVVSWSPEANVLSHGHAVYQLRVPMSDFANVSLAVGLTSSSPQTVVSSTRNLDFGKHQMPKNFSPTKSSTARGA